MTTVTYITECRMSKSIEPGIMIQKCYSSMLDATSAPLPDMVVSAVIKITGEYLVFSKYWGWTVVKRNTM